MKKGFTLAETIAVVIILGVIALFSVPALKRVIKENDTKQYQEYLESIYLATENFVYSTDYLKEELTENEIVFVPINDLVANGHLSANMKNPSTDSVIVLDDSIKVTYDENRLLKYEYVEGNGALTGYVTDGLILHYDGYHAPKLNGSILTWEDLSGNENNGTFYDNTLSNVYSKGYAKVNKTNRYVTSQTVFDNFTTTTSYTLEITYRVNDYVKNISDDSYYDAQILDRPYTLLSNQTYGHYYFSSYAKGDNYYAIVSMTRTPDDTANMHPLIQKTEEGYGLKNMLRTTVTRDTYDGTNIDFEYFNNGEKLDMINIDGQYFTDTVENLYVGKDYSYNWYSDAKIYSVRVYDRALTDEEIAQNYKIDAVRFR